LRRRERLVDGCIRRRRQNEGVFVDLPVFRVEREGRPVPAQGSGQIEPVKLRPVGRPRGLREQRIARIQHVVAILREGLPVQRVGARLGKDLHAREPRSIVLRREGIRVDADLADRRFRRQIPSRKPVDEDLSAARPGRRPGQRLQLQRQFVGIVG
jgi:hypothetical protein